MHSNEAYVTQAVQAGAKGYVLKESAGADIIQAVAVVLFAARRGIVRRSDGFVEQVYGDLQTERGRIEEASFELKLRSVISR